MVAVSMVDVFVYLVMAILFLGSGTLVAYCLLDLLGLWD